MAMNGARSMPEMMVGNSRRIGLQIRSEMPFSVMTIGLPGSGRTQLNNAFTKITSIRRLKHHVDDGRQRFQQISR